MMCSPRTRIVLYALAVTAEHVTYSPQAIGERVRALRHAGRYTQAGLAREMAERGFAWYPTTVARVEAGQRPVSLEEAAALTALFSVPLDSLGREEAP